MGKLKWTGKGLKILGDILEKGDLEDWLIGQGAALVKQKFETLTARWWCGRARAKSSVSTDVANAVNSDAFTSALQQHLESLPAHAAKVAVRLSSISPDVLHKQQYPYWTVAVPRWVVRAVYTKEILKDLGASKELARFTGLPQSLLARIAGRAEESFFTHLLDSKDITIIGTNAGICGVDRNFAWNGDCGHYYVAGTDSLVDDILKDKDRNALQKAVAPLLKELTSALGSMDTPTFDRIRDALDVAFR